MKSIFLIFALSLVISLLFIGPTNSSAFWGSKHDAITSEGLIFLRPEIRKQIIDGNIGEDSTGDFGLLGPAYHEENHFDACALRESSRNIQVKYSSAMMKTSANDPFGAASIFGKLLHTLQDFYSHSNWVELGQRKIIDSGLGMWQTIDSWRVLTGNVVPIEEPVKSGWSVADTPTGYSPVPKVTDAQGNMYKGLFTHGREAYRLGDHCPGGVQDWNHDQLNKDGPTRRDYAGHMNIHPYTEMHNRAVTLAVDQTEQEWCRYLNLLKSRHGYPSVSIPMALWVDKNGSPHPTGTACQNSELGDKSVIVSISSVKIIKDLDDGSNPGDYDFAFVLYTGDLRRSVRTQTDVIEGESGSFLPRDKLPQSLTMCLKQSDTLVATVQGWDDENGDVYKGVFNTKILKYDMSDGFYTSQKLADADQVVRGVTYSSSGPAFGQGIHTLTSANIEVTFQISRMPSCIPEGVTSKPTDTDEDGLVDSLDNCRQVANPDQKDIDNDRIGDACDLDLKDTDNDGVADSKDNCRETPNPDQKNTNGDEFGDACQQGDQDKDGVVDSVDNCRWVANPDQNADACKDVIL